MGYGSRYSTRVKRPRGRRGAGMKLLAYVCASLTLRFNGRPR
jgi:hypothetical protein